MPRAAMLGVLTGVEARVHLQVQPMLLELNEA